MKYNIFSFNQSKVISFNKISSKGKILKLDITDLLILEVISDFMNRKNIIKYVVNDKVYFSVQYKIILEDLPILNIKKQALSDRLQKMADLDIIEKVIVKNQSGTYIAFRMGSEYEGLKYSSNSETSLQMYSTTSADVVDYDPKYSSTNTTNKEDTSVSKKVCEIDSVDEDYIKFRKWMKKNCPFCDNPNHMKSSVITEDEFHKLKENYSSSEIANIILEIENRKDLRKNYCNLYTTVLKWLRNDKTRK